MPRSSLLVLLVSAFTALSSSAQEGGGAVVLSPAADHEWVTNQRGASFTFPWKEDNGRHGDVVRFPAGFDSGLYTHTASYWGVVIQGVLMNPSGEETTSVRLPPGSTWFVAGGAIHSTKCVSEEQCQFYVHQEAAFDFKPLP